MKLITITLSALLISTLVFLQPNNKSSQAAETLNIQNTIVYADNYTGTNDSEKIQKAIDFAAQKGNPKTVLLGNKDYALTKPIIVKPNVKLEGSYASKLVISDNFRAVEVQKNASLKGLYIAIDSSSFNEDVIYLNGSQKFYNSWNRTKIEDINIVNWSGTNKGTGISLFANGKGDEISFVTFENIKIADMGTAIELTSQKPSSGYAYINANNFNNIIIDNVVNGIYLDSSETVPNETSGNNFTNIQMQLSGVTKEAVHITGQYNHFDGMVWDTQTLKTKSPIINFTSASSYNEVLLRSSFKPSHYSDKGSNNKK